MKAYIKLISIVSVLAIVFAGVSIFCVSAEETEYIQSEKFIYGDVDLDGKVSVKDATLVQKDLAKITYATAVQKYLADPEGTGYSVKNATAIQKYLAKYEASPLFGVELVMSSQEKFSSEINFVSNMHYDVIRVFPKNIELKYSLSGFSEFSFNKIEEIPYYRYINGKIETTPYDFAYDLYFTSSNQEELVLAVKALDYRADIDLENIEIVKYDVFN